MNSKGYIVITDEMLSLPLDIWETVTYAIIYGFSQDGESTFHGSIRYLEKKVKCSRRKVINALARLVELGLVTKRESQNNGIKYCEYIAVGGSACGAPVVHEVHGVVHEVHGGSACGAPNNKEYNKDKNKEISHTSNARVREKFIVPTVYDVEAYCIAEGLTNVVAQDFCDHYEANGWKLSNGNRVADWKACARNWNRRQVEFANVARRKDTSHMSAMEFTLDQIQHWNHNN